MTQRDGTWYDRMYNNRALVPEFSAHLAHWRNASVQARAELQCFQDIAYGLGPNEILDIFPTPHVGEGGASVLVFIHGGYWRALDKSDHSFIAPAFTTQGAHVVVPNYALCPAVSVSHITLQMVKAVAWVWRNIHRFGGDPSRIVVVGHSAGGHLAAMLQACQWPTYAKDLPEQVVHKALSISGLFELESIRRTPFLADLNLSEDEALRNSPAYMPAPASGMLYSVVGGAESEEFLRHNQLIQHAWGKARVPVSEALPGLNHFSVVESLVQPGARLHSLASELLR
jgi:arylformamidase